MPHKLKEFLFRWANTFVGVVVATYLVHGIHYGRLLDLVVAALLLGILNAVLRLPLMVLTLPLMVLTLGLFTFVINGLLLYFTGWLLRPKFDVASFWAAFWGAFVISVVSFLLNVLTGAGSARIQVRTGRPPSNGGGPPVIDV